MNIVFWGEEHQCGTTAHMTAVAGVLSANGPQRQSVLASQMQRNQDPAAIHFYDCGTGLTSRKRHMLWHADLVVVNLKQDKTCVERFFRENLHISRNTFILLGGCYEGAQVDRAYLERVYRVDAERIGMIPYNHAFYQALQHQREGLFVKRESLLPADFRNEQFFRELKATAAMIVKAAKENQRPAVASTEEHADKTRVVKKDKSRRK